MATTSDLILTGRVARGYYLEDKSKSDLALELGISRFRVARLLEAARRDGMVRIQVITPGPVDTELSARVQNQYGLRHAVVLDLTDEEPTALRLRLGQAAAELIVHIATADDVIGLAWARSLRGIGDAITHLPPCPAVQLTGALTGPDGSDVLELVRRVARAGGGIPHVYYAPLVAGDVAAARALRRQPDVAKAAALVSQVTIAAVGIGGWSTGQSTIFDAIDPTARKSASALGVQAEISGALIDGHGQPVTSPLSQRIIGVTAAQLARIETVLAVAYGAGKAQPVQCALESGLVNALITDSGLARTLLGEERTTSHGRPDPSPTTSKNRARD